ncbi:hypothetical protein DCC85_18190 [Paenibacillus sp. CAA11]|uniref:oligosaccharide flippase family protein n=1 Tax=Paenibacillus sp. CAA11 TaxID=1532905 RepID=UPI000D3B8C56|nr:oligosaccharide flippase family protein [Paenibacillus sp. CAA11]AWB45930.1 hypothetical protein DCC85_18190 [Paenibacillus sp. CAA11]
MTIRAGAIIFVKALGLLGKIFMTRTIGTEGVGLYQLAYSFYGLVLMMISGGLPTALAIYTSKSPGEGKTLLKGLSLIILPAGLLFSLMIYLLSVSIARLLGYPQLDFAIKCLAPAVFVVPLLGLLRGYLQGNERYGVIAASEIVEQAIRIGLLMLLIPFFLPAGIVLATGGAMIGTSAGALTALLFLIACYWIFRSDKLAGSVKLPSALADIIKVSLAISLTRLLIPISDFLDAIVIPNRLQASGLSSVEAVEVLGVITGIALVVAYMPTLVTSALTHTMTMKMSADWSRHKFRAFHRKSNQAIETGWVWGIVSSLFLFNFSSEIAGYIFDVPEASTSIRALSFLPLLVGLREITTSILWARNQKNTPFTGLAVGVTVNFVLLYILVGIPGLKLTGIYMGIIALELIATLFNFKALELFSYLKTRGIVFLMDILFFAFLTFLCDLISKRVASSLLNTAVEVALYCVCSYVYLAYRYANLRLKT